MVAGAALCALSAQSPAAALLVLAKRDNTLAIVDPVSLKVVARVPAGPDPHEVVASPDGRLAYVSNYGGGAYNTISVIDLEARKPLPALDLGPLRGPHGLVVDGGKVWFTAEAAQSIGRYDPASRTIDWTFKTGQGGTHMIAVASSSSRVVTTNLGSSTASIIDRGADGEWMQTVVGVGRGAEGFDVSPDGTQIWVANAADGTVSIIDAASKKVVATLAANVMGANRVKFTRDGSRVLISTLSGPNVAVFDAASRREVRRVRVGQGAAGILMQPDGSRAYVACTPDGFVAVIDLKTLEVIGRIEAGRGPDGLAWASR